LLQTNLKYNLALTNGDQHRQIKTVGTQNDQNLENQRYSFTFESYAPNYSDLTNKRANSQPNHDLVANWYAIW
jgi:hypothetical protein